MHDVSQGVLGRVQANNADSTVFSVHTTCLIQRGINNSYYDWLFELRVLYKRHYKVFEVSCDKHSVSFTTFGDGFLADFFGEIFNLTKL